MFERLDFNSAVCKSIKVNDCKMDANMDTEHSCKMCGKHATLLRDHLLLEHAIKNGAATDPFKNPQSSKISCNFCPFKCFGEPDLTMHVASVHVDSEQCSNELENSRFHRVPCRCEICDQPFVDKQIYFNHLQTFHNDIPKVAISVDHPVPVNCPWCQTKFYTYQGFERHALMDHSVITDDLVEKVYRKEDGGICSHCGKLFAFYLVKHQVQEHGAALQSCSIIYTCDICTFSSKKYYRLQQHLIEAHTDRCLEEQFQQLSLQM